IRCATTPTVADGHVHPAKAFLLEAVHVLGQRVTRLPARFDPDGIQGVVELSPRGTELAVVTAIDVPATGAFLRAAEIRQHVPITPAVRALLLPAIEIQRIAAHIHQAVDGGRAAEHPPTRSM